MQIIGQDEAVRVARIVSKQRRHMLLVGPPGTGKSMIAQAIASLVPDPQMEIAVLHNQNRPERPLLDIRTKEDVRSKREPKPVGTILSPLQVPPFISERLGFRCRRCAHISSCEANACPSCGADKFYNPHGPFDDLIIAPGRNMREDRVSTTREIEGREEVVTFERAGAGKIRMLTQEELARINRLENEGMRKVLLALSRSTFVQATGASETELLGDVKHDPYGGHPQIGSQPYTRIVPGAVHEAHEGVLFVDELSSLGNLQRHILTAMQEKKFPIVGRNPSSTGASVRVDGVPCDFILVASVNINDVPGILPPLRSRIIGNGYECLVKTHMEDNEANQLALSQFVAQEIRRDGKIPHADSEALAAIIEEARSRAKLTDGISGLTLRLRALSGIIKLAGDEAMMDSSQLITAKHVKSAIERGRSIEEQLDSAYGSAFKAGMSDFAIKRSAKAEREVG